MGERFLFGVRKMDLVAESRVDDRQGEPEAGRAGRRLVQWPSFQPLPPLSEGLTVGKTRRQVRKASWSWDTAAERM